jgi:hypothetical protein
MDQGIVTSGVTWAVSILQRCGQLGGQTHLGASFQHNAQQRNVDDRRIAAQRVQRSTGSLFSQIVGLERHLTILAHCGRFGVPCQKHLKKIRRHSAQGKQIGV